MLKTLISVLRRDAYQLVLPRRAVSFQFQGFCSNKVPLTQGKVPKEEAVFDYSTISSDYKYNMSQLDEIYKLLRNRMDTMKIDKAIETLKVFALHKYESDDLYKKYEMLILKHINAIEIVDLVKAIKYLSYSGYQISEKFLLMIEHKIIKILGKINPQQFIDLLKAFLKFPNTSNKFYRTMQLFFIQKIKDFDISQSIEASYLLIISRRMSSAQFDEIVYFLHSRFPKEISVLTAENLLKFLNLIIIQKQVTEYRASNDPPTKSYEESKADIMSAIYGTPISQTKTQIPESSQKYYDLEKFLPKIVDMLQRYSSQGELNPKQLTVVIENLKELNAEIPDVFVSELIKETTINASIMDPLDFIRIIRLLHNIEISKELRDKLAETYKKYFYQFINDMNEHEVAESWSLIDYTKIPQFEDMLKKIEEHIKEKINSFQLPGLIRFTHLRIKTAHLLNASPTAEPDELLMKYLLPRVMLLLKRNKTSQDTLLVAKWIVALQINDQKLLEDFIGALKDVHIDKAIDYYHLTKFLEHIKEKNENQYGLCQSVLVFLEAKYKATGIEKVSGA